MQNNSEEKKKPSLKQVLDTEFKKHDIVPNYKVLNTKKRQNDIDSCGPICVEDTLRRMQGKKPYSYSDCALKERIKHIKSIIVNKDELETLPIEIQSEILTYLLAQCDYLIDNIYSKESNNKIFRNIKKAKNNLLNYFSNSTYDYEIYDSTLITPEKVKNHKFEYLTNILTKKGKYHRKFNVIKNTLIEKLKSIEERIIEEEKKDILNHNVTKAFNKIQILKENLVINTEEETTNLDANLIKEINELRRFIKYNIKPDIFEENEESFREIESINKSLKEFTEIQKKDIITHKIPIILDKINNIETRIDSNIDESLIHEIKEIKNFIKCNLEQNIFIETEEGFDKINFINKRMRRIRELQLRDISFEKIPTTFDKIEKISKKINNIDDKLVEELNELKYFIVNNIDQEIIDKDSNIFEKIKLINSHIEKFEQLIKRYNIVKEENNKSDCEVITIDNIINNDLYNKISEDSKQEFTSISISNKFAKHARSNSLENILVR